MLDLFDKRFASKCTAMQTSIVTAILAKRFSPSDDMSKYIDELETLFAQLEGIDDDTRIPKVIKPRSSWPVWGTSLP